jgi:hypothetical protein
MYHAAGADVPSTALFALRLFDEVTGVDLITHALVTEKVDGKPLGDSRGAVQRVREHAWVDLALGNFDVCGVGFSNLVMVRRDGSDKVFRVDGGCNVLFGADGTRARGLFSLDDVELNAFRDSNSSRSNTSTSKARVVGWSKVWKQSGQARIELLDPALTNRSLAVVPVEQIRKLEAALQEWLWEQTPLPEMCDMFDMVIARAMSIPKLVAVAPPPRGGGE